MKDIVEYIAKSIVSYPDEVQIIEEHDGNLVILKLEVAPDDKGKVIGRQGRVAQAMRVLIRVAAVKEETRASLEIV